MKAIYWTTTVALSGILLWSAYTYFFVKAAIDGFQELGFPSFFRTQLAVLKIVAAIVLLIPSIPMWMKEWAYAGVAFFFLTALVAHLAHKDPWYINALLLIFFGLLFSSYFYLYKI